MNNVKVFDPRKFWSEKIEGVTDPSVLAFVYEEFKGITNGRRNSLATDEYAIEVYLKVRVK